MHRVQRKARNYNRALCVVTSRKWSRKGKYRKEHGEGWEEGRSETHGTVGERLSLNCGNKTLKKLKRGLKTWCTITRGKNITVRSGRPRRGGEKGWAKFQ